MPRISRKLALTTAELDDLMTSSWNMRIATVGPGTRINLTPLWFAWVNGKVYFTGRGQKVVNLRRHPAATVLVDRNERFPELIGAMFQGTARVLEDAEQEAADPDLEAARWAHGTKYAGGHGEDATPRRSEATAAGETNRWMIFTPERFLTWDNRKIAGLHR
jgi:Pyridoxamine 5'-phosphate oxidase